MRSGLVKVPTQPGIGGNFSSGTAVTMITRHRRCARGDAHAAQHGQAVDEGHHHVDDAQVRHVLGEQRQRLGAAPCLAHGEAFLLEQRGELSRCA